MLCIDVSGSMLAEDFLPNRMEAAKEVAVRFVEGRATDRIGVVIFAGEPFTLCPLTTDHAVVLQQLYSIRSGSLQDGTAIGSGLATSVERLRNSDAASRVVVLLTDGENNGGIFPPSVAKELAKLYGIKVYTVGVGTEGYAMMPQQTREGVVRSREKVNIDEALLQEIATETGGRYFRARDKAALQTIYAEIDRLEKSRVQLIRYNRYTELFYVPALMALLLLLAEGWVRYRYLRPFP
jgi:Ca-activated chloride channel family protein